MAYTLKGVAGQNYNQLSPDEQAQVQSAGDAAFNKYKESVGASWDNPASGYQTSAPGVGLEAAQRFAEDIFTKRSDKIRLAQRALETGQVTIGDANTIPNLQAQGQGKLQGAVPEGSAADFLQKGLASGAVSPTDPQQQFAASMQGNTKNQPGITPIAPPDINAKYQQGLAQAQGAGVTSPSSGGDGRQIVQQYTPPGAQTNPVLDSLFQTDQNIANFSKEIQEFLSPTTQQQTFKQQYEDLVKQKGLEQLDTDLINLEAVMDATEDDLRTEITKAGGFATESQILALTNARNKTNLLKYNTLLKKKQAADSYIKNMLDLGEKDQNAAIQRMNMGINIANLQITMQKNAQDSLQKIADTVGYDGLASMAKGDPYYTSLIEKTLGLGVGGLAQLSTFSAGERAKEDAGEKLDRDYKQAQIDKIKFEMNPGSTEDNVTLPGVGTVPGSAAALATEYATTGKLPSAADLKAAGTTFGEITGIAKDLPKQQGEIVSTTTGVKPSNIPAETQGDFSRLYNITKMATELAELDKARKGGLVGGLLGKLTGSDAQAQYLTKRKAIIDEIARMQSGAALTAEEQAFYKEYLPGRFSEPLGFGQESANQIANFAYAMKQKLDNRLANNGLSIYGYSTVKVGDKEYKVGDVINNANGEARVNADGTVTPLGGNQQQTRASRNNNPLNIKASSVTKSYPGVAGLDEKPAADGGNFLKFSTPEDGFKAAERLITSSGYKNLSVDAALKRWSNSGYGGEIVPDLKGKTIAQLSPTELSKLIKTMARQEGYQA